MPHHLEDFGVVWHNHVLSEDCFPTGVCSRELDIPDTLQHPTGRCDSVSVTWSGLGSRVSEGNNQLLADVILTT